MQAAERLIAAEKGNEKIAVEVKSFIGNSPTSEFHAALGQFLNYRRALSGTEPDRKLYLAVPHEVYQAFFLKPFVQNTIEDFDLKIITYNPKSEVIVLWNDQNNTEIQLSN